MKRNKLLHLIEGIAGLFTLVVGFLGWNLFADLPSAEALPEHFMAPSLQVVDRNDRLLYEVLPEDGGRHQPVSLDSIPLYLRQATVATEDSRFYQHPGVDVSGILRAVWINLRGGETLAGGSTITQQVARNLLLSPEERYQITLRRKLRESYLAWQLSRRYTKDEILAFYLNQTYYGSYSYGVGAAALTYFGKPVSELDLSECALLAGLPQAPAVYSPFYDPQAARHRQEVVLRLMEESGFINPDQHQLAGRETLVYAKTPYPLEAPHFVFMALAELDRLFSPEEIRTGEGLRVQTTLDLDWQHQAEMFITRQLESLRRTPDGLGHQVSSASLVAIDPSSGAILTLVGSPDYHNEQIAGAINMALALRQPGSALKPLVYAAALTPDQSNPWTAATALLDVRTSFITHKGEAYTPSNYDLKEHGPVPIRVALASSLNIPAVITLEHIGLERFFDFAGELGLDTFGDPDQYDLSLALGGGEVRLLDLTAAYGAFANGGWRVQPYVIEQVTGLDGQILFSHQPQPAHRVMDERLAWLISDILSDDEARSLGFGRNSVLSIGRPAAVKTGTTSNFHDNWTIGYTPDLVVGVWAGNASYEPMRDVSGVTGAAPIWANFLRSVENGNPEMKTVQPPGLSQVEVCTLSGLLPGPYCPYNHLEWFIDGTEPTATDTLYHPVKIDIRTGRLATALTPQNQTTTRLVLDLPPQAQPWARAIGLLLLRDLEAVKSPNEQLAPPSTLGEPLLVIAPADHSLYRIDPDLDAQAQRLRIEVVCNAGMQNISVWVDGHQLVLLETPPYQAWWQLEVGEHHIWAQATNLDDSKLSSTVITITVTR